MRYKKLILVSAFLFLTMTMLSNGVQVQAAKPDNFFFAHMIAPTSNPVRMQYSQLMEGELPKIGIGTELDLISWAALGPRATDQEVGTYAEGGYDICFFGMNLGTPAGHPGDSMQGVYGSTAIPPAGFNVMYWSPETGKNYMNYRAQDSDDIIEEINTNLNLTEAKADLIDWQKLWYDAMPNVIIYNQYEVHAVSKGLYGYDPIFYPLNTIEDVWLTTDYTGTADQVVLAASTGGDTFNPMIATDVYDQYGNNPAFDATVGNTPSKEAVLPSGTVRDTWMEDKYNTTEYLKLYPRVATSTGTFATDGKSFALDIRDDVYFHDGHQVDAWDVALSQQAHLIPAIGSSSYSNNIVPFGMDDKAGKHGNYSFTVTDEDSDGFYEHLNYTMNVTYAPFSTNVLGTWIFPEHILGDPVNHGFDTNGDFDPDSTWITRPGDWRSHSTTTGRTTDPGGYPGPISCGSMIFESFDSTASIITLKKFENIKWDNTTGAWVTDTLDHWNIDNLGDMPDTAKIIVARMDSAIADMKTGGVNIMDPQFTMANILDELQTEASIQSILSPRTGWQAMWLNPKFEYQETHPLNKKGVRHAISHAIPRENLTTRYLNFVTPAYTPLPQTSWGAISEPEMVEYKKTLKATDGTTPLANSTTAYDEYSIDLALDWLETEGYDTTPWREKSTTTLKITGFELLITTLTLTSGGLLFKHRRQGALS
jgi:ABC-type transport system substrate-binding protein